MDFMSKGRVPGKLQEKYRGCRKYAGITEGFHSHQRTVPDASERKHQEARVEEETWQGFIEAKHKNPEAKDEIPGQWKVSGNKAEILKAQRRNPGGKRQDSRGKGKDSHGIRQDSGSRERIPEAIDKIPEAPPRSPGGRDKIPEAKQKVFWGKAEDEYRSKDEIPKAPAVIPEPKEGHLRQRQDSGCKWRKRRLH